MRNPEALLLVNNEQAQPFKYNIFLNYPVRAYYNVNFSGF
jgi:hypothetical protein